MGADATFDGVGVLRRTFTSLSAAARTITGCAVNGWRFLSLAGAGAEGKGEAAPAGGSSFEVYAGGAGPQVAEPRRTCRKVKCGASD